MRRITKKWRDDGGAHASSAKLCEVAGAIGDEQVGTMHISTILLPIWRSVETVRLRCTPARFASLLTRGKAR